MNGPKSYKTREICPQTGIWCNTETCETIPLSRGQRFPPFNSKIARWELFKADNLLSKELLKL